MMLAALGLAQIRADDGRLPALQALLLTSAWGAGTWARSAAWRVTRPWEGR